MNYSDDVFKADGDPLSADPTMRHPRVSQDAKDFIFDGTSISEQLFEASELFRVPLTNNYSWFEDDDPNKPIYHYSEFEEMIVSIFLKGGWTPPEEGLNSINKDYLKKILELDE